MEATPWEQRLAEEIGRLRSTGLSDQEAYWVASRRLGTAEPTTLAYATADLPRPGAQRLVWALMGILLFRALNALINIVLVGAAWLAALGGLRGHGLGVLAVAVHALLLVAAGVWVIRWCLAAPNLPDRLSVTTLVVGGVVLVVMDVIATLASLIGPPLIMHVVSMADYALMARTRSVTSLAWSALLPVVLLVLLVWIQRRGVRDSAARP